MRPRTLVTALITLGVVMALTSVGTAGTRADTTVTIKTKNGDFWGYVKSTRPFKCAKNRTIVLFKQVGSTQAPKVDQKIASDTASLVAGRYMWSTGNTGMYGKFYARAKRTTYCKADNTDTVRSVRS